jgi:hypothetical protein
MTRMSRSRPCGPGRHTVVSLLTSAWVSILADAFKFTLVKVILASQSAEPRPTRGLAVGPARRPSHLALADGPMT